MAISKMDCFCSLKDTTVTAMVNLYRTGKGAKASEQATIIMCDGAAKCGKTDYCKFVNPLSNRNPLEFIERKEVEPDSVRAS
mgnify:CR=1 FL=1